MRPVAYWKSTAVPAQRPASASAPRRGAPSHANAKPAIANAPAASCSKNVGASGAASVATPKIAAVAAPVPGDEPLAEPADEEDGDEEEHAGGEHADQPERRVALRLPVDRRLRDPGGTLELVRGNGEERHAGRLVRVRAAVEHRAVEQARLEHERVVEDEVPRQLVARAVLRAGRG